MANDWNQEMKFEIKVSDYCTPLCPYLEINKSIVGNSSGFKIPIMTCQNKEICQFVGDLAINQYKRTQEETECI